MTVRSTLSSPWLAGLLALLVVALAAGAVLLPPYLAGLAAGPTPGPTASPGTTPPASVAPTDPGPTFAYPTPSPQPTFLSYRVRVGDTLNSIATQHRTTARSIAWWNRGTYPSLDPESATYEPDRIELGWTLVLIPGVVVDENNPPSPSPVPATPSPAPTGTPKPTLAPTASAAPAAIVISHGSRTAGQIALTFDMGGRLDPAVAIVQWLVDHKVKATLFPTGQMGTTTTGSTALTIAAAHPELFDLGNHSWNHPSFTTLTATEIADQLRRCEAAIAPIVGQTTKPWFRPPFGSYNDAVRSAVGRAGWKYLVMWDVDTIDWRATSDGGPTAGDIVAKITSKAQSGSIVLMHLGGWHTLEALPGILAAVQAKGLAPVTLGTMLGS